MDNPTPTLARGQARSLYKMIEDRLHQGIKRMEQATLNTPENKMYKTTTRTIDRQMRDLVIDKIITGKKGKRSKCIYLIMAPGDIPGRISADLVEITAYPPDLRNKLSPICVTRHCIERVFQRLRIQDYDVAIEIIKILLDELVTLKSKGLSGNEKIPDKL